MIKRTIHICGGLLSVIALGWVLWPLMYNLRRANGGGEAGRMIVAAMVASFAYALLTPLLALAWWWLCGLDDKRVGLSQGYAVWSRSQIAKYLPGNIFHYVGRQILGRRVGISHVALIAAGILEMVSLLLAALVISLGEMGWSHPGVASSLLPLSVLAPIMALMAWPWIDPRLRRFAVFKRLLQPLPRLRYRELGLLALPALVLHLAFLLGTGLILLGLLRAGWPAQAAAVSARQVVWCYSIAWLAGTVTVGSPGGVGVREAVLTYILGPALGQPQAAALALTLRLATVLGDCWTAMAGWLIPLQPAAASQPSKQTPPISGEMESKAVNP